MSVLTGSGAVYGGDGQELKPGDAPAAGLYTVAVGVCSSTRPARPLRASARPPPPPLPLDAAGLDLEHLVDLDAAELAQTDCSRSCWLRPFPTSRPGRVLELVDLRPEELMALDRKASGKHILISARRQRIRSLQVAVL
jgi:hypothetical protein